MSRVFYDHLIILEEVETELSTSKLSSTDKKEIDQMIEESVHFRVITKILDHLPREHHREFLEIFHQAPHSESVFNFLKDKISDIEKIIKDEVSTLEKELLKEIKSFKSRGA